MKNSETCVKKCAQNIVYFRFRVKDRFATDMSIVEASNQKIW